MSRSRSRGAADLDVDGARRAGGGGVGGARALAEAEGDRVRRRDEEDVGAVARAVGHEGDERRAVPASRAAGGAGQPCARARSTIRVSSAARDGRQVDGDHQDGVGAGRDRPGATGVESLVQPAALLGDAAGAQRARRGRGPRGRPR